MQYQVIDTACPSIDTTSPTLTLPTSMTLSHRRTLHVLALLLLTSLLVGCSNSTNTDNETATDNNTDTTGNSGTDSVGTTTGSTDGSGENDNGSADDGETNTDTGEQSTDENTSSSNPPADNNNPQSPETPTDTVAPDSGGSDESGSDDDSPTETESASLVGPFIKDTNRSAGPPSVPTGLTLLMSGEDFLEFTWKPSSDDQSVEGYEIYRDGTMVFNVRGDGSVAGGNIELDYRNWITTSYMDCNYTKYTACEDHPMVPGSSYEYQVLAVDNEGMKSALSEPVIFALAQKQNGPADLSGYAQVLNEEFNGESLDRAVWKTSLPWGPNEIINSERQYFVNLFANDPLPVNPFVFTGTTLQITGSVTPPEYLALANQQPYLSGVISTKDKFQMTYGYVEMNAKVMNGEGFLSTFYLFNQDFEKNKPEIDVVEYKGAQPNQAFHTYHYYDSQRSRYSVGERHSTPTMESNTGVNLSSGFHTYSVLWEPGLIVWYIDGNEVRRLTGVRVADEPMNIIAQLVVGSEWIGEPDTSLLPATFEIDYIRAWQKQ